jgi:hypothetical protein
MGPFYVFFNGLNVHYVQYFDGVFCDCSTYTGLHQSFPGTLILLQWPEQDEQNSVITMIPRCFKKFSTEIQSSLKIYFDDESG